MDSKFDRYGFVKNDFLKHVTIAHKQGGGLFKEYDRITEIYDKNTCGIVWQIESRLFNCCGTSGFESLNAASDDPTYYQEILALICEHMPYYSSPRAAVSSGAAWSLPFKNWPDALFVDTREDLNYSKNKNTLIKILFGELKAKEVYSFDNQVHYSSGLVMCSWNPKHCVEELEKYLFFTNENKTSWIPKYLEQEWKDHVKDQESNRAPAATKTGTALPVEAQVAQQWGNPARPIGNGDVGFVRGGGIQQPQPHQDYANRVGVNPVRPNAKQGV